MNCVIYICSIRPLFYTRDSIEQVPIKYTMRPVEHFNVRRNSIASVDDIDVSLNATK